MCLCVCVRACCARADLFIWKQQTVEVGNEILRPSKRENPSLHQQVRPVASPDHAIAIWSVCWGEWTLYIYFKWYISREHFMRDSHAWLSSDLCDSQSAHWEWFCHEQNFLDNTYFQNKTV